MRIFKKQHIPKLLLSKEQRLCFSQFVSGHAWLSLDIEIGCGVGLHPLNYVQANKGRGLIALERTKTKFNKFMNRFNFHLKSNADLGKYLLPVGGDGVSFLSEFVPPQSVENYFLLHPNPYPKAQHLNKRWHAMPAMSLLVDTLKPGGCITLATNQKFYYEEALVYMRDVWKFSILEQTTYSKGDIEGRTHFERKYLSRGEVIFNVVFKKPMLN